MLTIRNITYNKKTLVMFDIEHDGKSAIFLRFGKIVECVFNTGLDKEILKEQFNNINFNINNIEIDEYKNTNVFRITDVCRVCGSKGISYKLIANSENYKYFKEFALSEHYKAHIDCLGKSVVCEICGKLKLRKFECNHCKDGKNEFRNDYKLSKILAKIYSARKKLFYLGIELELEAQLNSIPFELEEIRKETSKYAIQLDKYLLYGIYEDLSLNFGNEFCTLPKYYNFYFTHKFKLFFDKLMSRSESNQRAGVHINVPKRLFDFNQLQAIQRIFNDIACNSQLYNNFLLYLERTHRSMSQFALLYNELGLYQVNKNYALNTKNSLRVEFRLFGSTNDYQKLLSYIQFVKAIYKYTKGKTHYKVSFSGFANFIRNNYEFNLLYKYLLDYNLI